MNELGWINLESFKRFENFDYVSINPFKRLRDCTIDYTNRAMNRCKSVPQSCNSDKLCKNARKQKFKKHDHDLVSKNAILKVSPSVVGLVSYSGGEQVFWGSGFIFEASLENDSFSYLVLTSATLLRPPRSDACDNRPLKEKNIHRRYDIKPEEEGYVPIDEMIGVCLSGFGLHVGTVVASDFHFNIAVLEFKSKYHIPCAVLRPIDDSFDFLAPICSKGCTCNFDSRLRLIPEDKVIAVGRYTDSPFQIMTVPGEYSFKNLDKMELLRANCRITKCGIGGPLISCEGEVIGVNFYAEDYTPFLPINIFLLWWSYFNDTRCPRRPWLGMEVENHYYTSELGFCERLWNLGISQGVLVKKVAPSSPAEISGLCPGDVIIKCDGQTVKSPLQFSELIWDMAGKVVEAAVIRNDSFQNVNIEIKDITLAEEFYQWRLPREYY